MTLSLASKAPALEKVRGLFYFNILISLKVSSMTRQSNLNILAENTHKQLESILSIVQQLGFTIEHYQFQEQLLEQSLHIQLQVSGEGGATQLCSQLEKQAGIIEASSFKPSRLQYSLG